MPSIVYIDPQSYNNLSLYDRGMLSAMNSEDVVLFGSNQWDCDTPNAELKKWFNYSNKKNAVSKGLSYLATILRIASYIRKHKEIRVVHIQWLRLWKVDILFTRWLKRKGITVVFTAHNILPHDSVDSQRENYGIYYKTVDKICVHTATTKQELIDQFEVDPDKVEIIPHGIIYSDVAEETITSRAKSLKAKYKISPETLVISSLGIQSYYKGIDILIDLWSNEKDFYANPNIKLMVVGKNSNLDYSPLEGIGNVIIENERISNEDFQAYLEISDVILLPYRKISQSGMLFSAIARNKPVVISNIGGLPDPLEIGNVGWNIGTADEESLGKTLKELVQCPEMVRSLHRNSVEFQKVKDYYSWESISKKLRSLYDRLIYQSIRL